MAQKRHDNVTLHETFFGKKSDLSHVRIFGSISYIHIPNEKWHKLNPKSEKCIFVGYSLEQKAYKCYNLLGKLVPPDVIYIKLESGYQPVRMKADREMDWMKANKESNRTKTTHP